MCADSAVRFRQAQRTDARAIARVHVDTWRTAYRGIVPDDYLRQLSYDRREDVWTSRLSDGEPSCRVYVAEDASGQVVGFADGGPERSGDPVYRGELYAIYVLAHFQHLGIGQTLVRLVATHLADHGMPSMLVWVLARNPARRFYAALGGREVRRRRLEVGGRTLVEIAFGWEDTAPLRSPRQLRHRSCHP